MLLADSRYYADARMHQVTDLLYVTALLCAHLYNEYFVVWREVFAYGAYDAHCGVVASRGHQDIKMFGQYRFEIVFGACLSVASGDADDLKAWHCLKPTFGVAVVVPVYMSLDR